MPSKFQPRIARSRFVVTPFTPERMIALGNVLVEDIQARLDRAENVADAPAAPLRPRYAKWKARKYPPAIRNLKLTGRTRRGFKVTAASDGRVMIGFTDPVAEKRVSFQKRREVQWGVSPRNRERVEAEINKLRAVRVGKGS